LKQASVARVSPDPYTIFKASAAEIHVEMQVFEIRVVDTQPRYLLFDFLDTILDDIAPFQIEGPGF
jgi:hypothetical protein